MIEFIIEVVSYILVILLGYYLRILDERHKRKQEYPYSYACPEQGCFYEIAANDMEFVDRMIIRHKREEHHLA